MSQTDEAAVRAAYKAYGQREMTRLLCLVHPDLERNYPDPGAADPQPQVCQGRAELAANVSQRAEQGLASHVGEFASSGDKVMVTVRTPGAGQITAMQAFRERGGAYGFAGLDQDDR